jgi:2-keto-4-pentenoate hydratase/2-oxohepta-3-ene-1,7-dioic acid hydratase in catechol pathway
MAPRVAAAAVRALRRAAHSYAFPPPAVTALPVDGANQLFPVRRVFCVGRNYAAVRRRRQARRPLRACDRAAA